MGGNPLNQDDFGYVLIAALRYQLPRHTYGSGIVARAVWQVWPSLRGRDRGVIRRDLIEALDAGQTGADCDRTQWRWLLDRIDTDAEAPSAPPPAPPTR